MDPLGVQEEESTKAVVEALHIRKAGSKEPVILDRGQWWTPYTPLRSEGGNKKRDLKL